ncbi:hypothetical protein T05_11036 [Trichinella murrelli]|uniref:Uncharacterized protein n=1 Tax=Trichinella murrelli TaxID=144512 RepID=A0A0V0SPE5_9BILA|nr:hypothetical protein T05_11036 [Trichinella murrelli]
MEIDRLRNRNQKIIPPMGSYQSSAHHRIHPIVQE